MAPQLVFITGATGFIGSQTALATLQAGYRARLSVRKHEQIDKLKNIFAKFLDRVEFVVVPDFTDVNATAAALDNVDHVFHLASPMPGKGQDVKKDYVDPAVKGTEAMLAAASKQSTVKSVVVTASLFSLMPFGAIGNPNNVIKENTGEVFPVDMNFPFPEDFNGHGLKYQASKMLAHQASRDFVQANKPHYKLITLHPVFVVGDSLIQSSPESIDAINAWFWNTLKSEKGTMPNSWVHVRDVADAHVKTLTADIPSGTEFLLSAPPIDWQQVLQFLKQNYPEVEVKLQSPFDGSWNSDTSAAAKYLDIEWRSWQQMVRDTVNQQLSFEK